MKSKIIETVIEEEVKGFDTPGLYKLSGQDVYALCSGQCEEDLNKTYFPGTIVHSTSTDYPLGFYSEFLTKKAWVRITKPVAIEFYD